VSNEQTETTPGDGIIRITEPKAVVYISSPLAYVRVTGPSCVVEVAGSPSQQEEIERLREIIRTRHYEAINE
jgi:hypothetical protein